MFTLDTKVYTCIDINGYSLWVCRRRSLVYIFLRCSALSDTPPQITSSFCTLAQQPLCLFSFSFSLCERKQTARIAVKCVRLFFIFIFFIIFLTFLFDSMYEGGTSCTRTVIIRYGSCNIFCCIMLLLCDPQGSRKSHFWLQGITCYSARLSTHTHTHRE